MRARNLKPALFVNEDLGTGDPYLTILFEGLWCIADRDGRLEDRPKKIAALIFPYRNFSDKKIEGFLSELAAMGFIRRYVELGQQLIQVVNFVKHQRPHNTEKLSELPAEVIHFQQDTGITVNDTLDNALIPDSLIPDSLTPDTPKAELRPDEADTVFEYWQKVHSKQKAQFTIERKRKVRERLKDGTIEEVLLAIDGCKRSVFHQGQNDKGIKYDDLELICRTRTQLEKFISYNSANGHAQKPDNRSVGAHDPEDEAEQIPLNCRSCSDTGTIWGGAVGIVPCPDCSQANTEK